MRALNFRILEAVLKFLLPFLNLRKSSCDHRIFSAIFGIPRRTVGRHSEFSHFFRNLRCNLQLRALWFVFFVFQVVEHVGRLFHNSFERSCKIFSWLSVLFSRVILLHSAFKALFDKNLMFEDNFSSNKTI